MPALFDLLYREYCRARLAEMRQQLLIPADTREVPEANCDASHSDGASDRGDDQADAALEGIFASEGVITVIAPSEPE